jgi:hypothetical protein
MSILLFLGVAIAFANPSSSTKPEVDEPSCPVAAPGQVSYVRLFFTVEETRSFREQYGLLDISPDDIRLLTDDGDTNACRRIAEAVILDQTGPYPKVWHGFQAGDFYVVMVSRELPPGVFYHGGGTGLVVLNADMEVVAAAS